VVSAGEVSGDAAGEVAGEVAGAALSAAPEASGSMEDAASESRWDLTVWARLELGSSSMTLFHSAWTPAQSGTAWFRYRKPRS
jgi:hypothetical protein